MINELTPEQKAATSLYVEKWIKIGLSTDPTDLEGTKKWITKIYENAKLEPPKYWFHFSDPYTSLKAIYMVELLSGFSDKNQDTKIYSDTDEYLDIFNSLYEQYSNQYDLIDWNDDVKARMLSMVSKGFESSNEAKRKTAMKGYFEQYLYGPHEAGWLSFYDFFHKECNLECVEPIAPYFELAKTCGWWSAYSEVAFIQDRPRSIVMNDNGKLHNLSGPAIEYPSGLKIYAIDNYLVPEYVVMDPNLITVEMIDKETNAELRRIYLQQYGFERYFENADCKLVDSDEVFVEQGNERKMPRMLVTTKHGDCYLIGTDGGTHRKYFMNVFNSQNKNRIEDRFGKINTCVKAHQLICGINEDDLLFQC
jgi:hypothetical protein